MKCWICGQVANSREYIVKKSDLVRGYGNGPYKGNDELAHFKGDNQRTIQGPDSKIVKYPKSLCHACNTSRTQKYDASYDNFIDYVYQNEEKLLKEEKVYLPNVRISLNVVGFYPNYLILFDIGKYE